jgi:hypothetical protein
MIARAVHSPSKIFAVIDAGAIGLAIAAWRLARRGAKVVVFDRGELDRAPTMPRGWFLPPGIIATPILPTPITAQAVSDLVLDGITDPLVQSFGLQRFVSALVAE